MFSSNIHIENEKTQSPINKLWLSKTRVDGMMLVLSQLLQTSYDEILATR